MGMDFENVSLHQMATFINSFTPIDELIVRYEKKLYELRIKVICYENMLEMFEKMKNELDDGSSVVGDDI